MNEDDAKECIIEESLAESIAFTTRKKAFTNTRASKNGEENVENTFLNVGQGPRGQTINADMGHTNVRWTLLKW